MKQALYRKWRPQTFADVVGQDTIVSILSYELANRKTTHAYLFCGSRGTGKTTCAKLLAKAVNCEHPNGVHPCGTCAACRAIDNGTTTDVLEIDAASNTGVDNIRDIRDAVAYPPAELKMRVYIIDEVHMLSISAFNALLKTLEEPPGQVMFILATTELHKVPATILSRCKRFDFRRVATPTIAARLRTIADAEGISITDDAAFAIARLAQGGLRDAISLLEFCAGTGENITYERVMEASGAGGRDAVYAAIRAVCARDYGAIFTQIAALYQSSKDIAVFWQELLACYRDLLVVKTLPEPVSYLDITEQEHAELAELAKPLSVETILYHTDLLSSALTEIQRGANDRRLTAELTLLRLCDPQTDTSVSALLARIEKLEAALATGARPATLATSAKTADAPAAPSAPPTAKPTSVAAPAREPAKTADLQGVSCWAEVISRVAKSDPSIGAWLARATAYFSPADKRIFIEVANSFEAGMIDQPLLKGEIAAALASEDSRYTCAEADIVVRVRKTRTTRAPIDEL